MQVATSTGMQHYIKMHCYGFDCLLHITAESLKIHHAAEFLQLTQFLAAQMIILLHSSTLLKPETLEMLIFMSLLGYLFWTIQSFIMIF